MASIYQEIETLEHVEHQDDIAENKATSIILLLCGSIFSILLVGRILQYILFKPCNLPGPNANAFLFYFSGLKAAYRLCPDSIPLACLIFQGICGLCKVFDPQKIVQGYLLFRPVVLFFKPETVEVVLSSTSLLDKANEYSFLHPWIGTGLLTSSGEKWRKRRKLLTPTFHFSILEDFIPIFNEQASTLVSNLSTLTSENWIDVVPEMTSVSLGIICETAMGIRINKKGREYVEYIQAVKGLGDAFFYRVLRPWLYPKVIYNLTSFGRKYNSDLRRVRHFAKKVIKDKKADMLKSESGNANGAEGNAGFIKMKKRRVFLELLLEQHLKDPSFTEEDVREEVDTFMFEGHDTTSIAMSWTLYFVGLDQDVQKKVHEEMDDIFGNDTNRDITREDLSQMKYLECVIKETLRFCPSVPFFARQAHESFKVLDYTVQKGSGILIFPYVLHQDKESFPEPEKFIPERFLPENSVGRHTYAYVPFSAGPRNCIGQRFANMVLKTVLAHVFRRYQVTSLDPRDRMHVIPFFVTRNVEPIRLRFKVREQTGKPQEERKTGT